MSNSIPMSEKQDLDVGGTATFPTWAAGHRTTLKIQNKESKEGKISVHAAGAQEDVSLTGNEFKEIVRDWAGVYISVSNSGNTKVSVQTA